MPENVELAIRDVVEELKELNKQLEVLNETFIALAWAGSDDGNVFAKYLEGRDQARAYLAARKQQQSKSV